MDKLYSNKFLIKLHKIECSNEVSILGLDSNYSPSDTLDDVGCLVESPEFCNALTTSPQTFAVVVDDDGYDIEPCDDCEINPCESLEQVLKKGITLYRNLYILHWMAKGNDMMKLHTLTEDMYDTLIEEIDTTGELLVEKCGTVPQPDWVVDYIQVKPYEFQESLDILNKFIQEYIDCIDYAYPNQTSDVQSVFDEWLRYWNKQMNYFVKRQEV